MSVAPLGGLTGVPGALPPLPAGPAAPGPGGFGDMVSQYLTEANVQQQNVGRQIEALATGQTDNIHDVVLSVAKADLAFRMVMEIRNRLISSYQEVMRMQV